MNRILFCFILISILGAAGCGGRAAGTGPDKTPGESAVPSAVRAEASPTPVPVAARKLAIPKIDTPLNNPFIGWCPWAVGGVNKYTPYQPHTLVFSLIDWRIFEPQEGVFNADALKKSMNYDIWAGANVKYILRPVLDYPVAGADKPNRYIPDWLYDKMTGQEGTAGAQYDNSYGVGFSPDYTSQILQDAHKRFISNLGELFDRDPAVAFVELGSVGHWGEWHTNYDEGVPKLPPSRVTDIYARHYIDAFPDKKLLMRRPFAIAKANGMGLYDDSFLLDNKSWLQWINFGYIDPATDENQPAMPDFWRFGPSGGELASGFKPKALADPQACVDWINLCHTTFIGPSSLTSGLAADGDFEAADKIRNAMGYRLRVESAEIRQTGDTAVLTLNWVNDGTAPFYYPWPIMLEIADTGGNSLYTKKTDWDIRGIMPDGGSSFSVNINASIFEDNDVKVKVSIADPDGKIPGVYLAQDYGDGAGGYTLMEVTNGIASLPH